MKKENKLFAIFGNPVTHSLSPLMHNYALQGLNINGCYTRYQLKDPKLFKKKFLQLGLVGINVTVPHKEVAFKSCDEIKGIANDIGAVNTVINEEGKLIGYNTDAPGFFKSASSFGEIKNVLILGAGGTAKALAAIFRKNAIPCTILNRSQKRLDFFIQKGYTCFDWKSFKFQTYDLIVNTTSAGLQDNNLPLPQTMLKEIFANAKYAIDVIYNQNTPFLQLACEHNLMVKDGSEMLLNQGVYAFEIFFNLLYKEEDIFYFMQKAFA